MRQDGQLGRIYSAGLEAGDSSTRDGKSRDNDGTSGYGGVRMTAP